MDKNQPTSISTTTLPDVSNIILQLSLNDIKNLVTQKIITQTQASQIWNMYTPQESFVTQMQSFDQKPPLTIDSRTDFQHILLNDYHLLNIIPLFYVFLLIAFPLFLHSFSLLDLIIKQEKIKKPMKMLAQFFKFILIVIALKFALWLQLGQAFVFSFIVILFSCVQLREQIVQPIIFYLFVDEKKKKKIDDYLEKFRQKITQKESDLMQNFIYSSQLNSLNHPAPFIALILLFSQVIFFFVASLFLYSEFITILFWLNMTFIVSFVTQIFKKLNRNNFPFEPIFQIILSLLLPVIGMFLDKIIAINSYHTFISICISILPITSGIQNLIYMLLLDDAIESRSKLQVGRKLGNLSEMEKISGWKKKLSAFIILALPLIQIYIGLRKSIWPLLVTGFFTFKNVSMIYFALVKNAMLFDTLTPIFLLFMTFQMNQTQIDSYSYTPVINIRKLIIVLSYFIEQSTLHFQVFYFVIRMAAIVSLISLSGTLQTMKKQFEAAKKFNSDQEQSALQKSGTLQFFEFVQSVFWAHLIVSLSLYFAQKEQSAFFSLIYQLIAIFFMIKPNIGILVINGLWKIQYAIMLSTLLAWRLSILSLNLFLPFQASGVLFCLSILLTVLVQDEKKSKYLQIALMAIFFLHGVLSKSNIYIFEFALLLHFLVPITNSLMKKRRKEKLRSKNRQDDKQANDEEQGQKKKSNPEYLLLWICVFCLLGFSFGTITEGVYDFTNSITGNIILERFYSIEFKQFEIILAQKAVNLFEYFTQVA